MVLTIKDVAKLQRRPRSPSKYELAKEKTEEKQSQQAIGKNSNVNQTRQIKNDKQNNKPAETIIARTETETTRTASHTGTTTHRSLIHSHVHEQAHQVIEKHEDGDYDDADADEDEDDNDDNYSVHLFRLIVQKRFEDAIQRIHDVPEEAYMYNNQTHDDNEEQNKGYNLALHEACKQQSVPIDLIQVLLEANLDAISTPGEWGYLPLHWACCVKSSSEVVAHLLSVYPSASRHRDNPEGKLPLHLACQWLAPTDGIILLLLTVYPKASTIKDASGRIPLDHVQFQRVVETGDGGASPRLNRTTSSTVSILQHLAPLLMATTKAARDKLEYDNDMKLQQIIQSYKERMEHVKEQYQHDKSLSESLEAKLQLELEETKNDTNIVKRQMAKLEKKLKQKEDELNQAKQLLSQISGLMKTDITSLDILTTREALSPRKQDDLEQLPRYHRPTILETSRVGDTTQIEQRRNEFQRKYRIDPMAHGNNVKEHYNTEYTTPKLDRYFDNYPTPSHENRNKEDDVGMQPNAEEIIHATLSGKRFKRRDEQRDPPPLSELTLYDDTEDDGLTSDRHPKKHSPLSNAVASVKDWIPHSLQAEGLSQEADDLLNRLLSSEKSPRKVYSTLPGKGDKDVILKSTRRENDYYDRYRKDFIRHGHTTETMNNILHHHLTDKGGHNSPTKVIRDDSTFKKSKSNPRNSIGKSKSSKSKLDYIRSVDQYKEQQQQSNETSDLISRYRHENIYSNKTIKSKSFASQAAQRMNRQGKESSKKEKRKQPYEVMIEKKKSSKIESNYYDCPNNNSKVSRRIGAYADDGRNDDCVSEASTLFSAMIE